MRTFLLVSIVAIAVACIVAYEVGLVAVTTEHPEGKCVVRLIINTAMLQHSAGDTVSMSHHPTPGENALDVKGRITVVRPDKNEVVVSENIKNWTFQLTKDGRVYLNDRESKLGDLQAGDDAIVTFDRQGELLFAREIRATRK
jgi:hypothetical protein